MYTHTQIYIYNMFGGIPPFPNHFWVPLQASAFHPSPTMTPTRLAAELPRPADVPCRWLALFGSGKAGQLGIRGWYWGVYVIIYIIYL